MTKFVSLSEAKTAIKTLGTEITFLLEGAPGCGKSSVLSEFKETHLCVYLDMADKSLGDLGLPFVIDGETHIAPTALLQFKQAQALGKPIAIMVDEMGKASKEAFNMVLPLVNERRFADYYLPKDSIVFATTNLSTDGVGDRFPAHGRNRVTTLHVYGPTVKEWSEWAIAAGVDPIVIAWILNTPEALDCYAYPMSGKNPDVNPYIFNPKKGNTKFFTSHRSVARAGSIVGARHELGGAFGACLSGTIGESAAADMAAYIAAGDSMATMESILRDPTNAKLPDGVASFIMSLRCAATINKENAEPILTYVHRWKTEEAKALFTTNVCAIPGNIGLLATNKKFSELIMSYSKAHMAG